jgi:hypothetical protein
MKESIDDFIRNQRDAFDVHEPATNGWENIAHRLNVEKKTSNTSWRMEYWWRVAAIFFMGLSAFLLTQQDSIQEKTAFAMDDFGDVETFYVKEISNKMALISEFNTYDEEAYAQNLQQLDAMYLVLKEEMKVAPSQKVKDALILNLMVRIDLLNKQLQVLEEKKEARTKQKST